jgi:LacI family transcriptional regulator
MKKVPMQIIADRLGIFKFTVSQALSGKSGVGANTRQRVLDMAETLGHRVKAGNTEERLPEPGGAEGTVLLSIRKEFRIEPDFWVRVMEGVTAACTANGWKWRILEDTELLPQHPIKKQDEEIVGILVLGIAPRQQLLVLQNTGYPLVLIDHEDPLIEADVRHTVRHLRRRFPMRQRPDRYGAAASL